MTIPFNYKDRAKNYILLIALSLFFLPFRNNISSVFGIALFLFFFIDKENKPLSKLKVLLGNKIAILTLSIYIVHLIGLKYTSNFKYASLDLEIKLPLFILPFVIFAEKKLTFENLNVVLKYFTIGNILAVSFCFIRAGYRFYVTKSATVLFYNEFSNFMHPSYFSLYLGFNTIYLFYKISNSDRKQLNHTKNQIILLTISTLFIFGILTLSSKAGILIAALALLFFSIKELIKKKITLILLLSAISVIVFLLISYFKNNIVALSRFEEAKQELSSKSNSSNETNGSSNARLEIWKSSKKVLLKNLAIGVGTGDIKDELIKQYKKDDFTHGVVNENNCHNQYLQFFILFGVGGGLLFIVSLLYPAIISIRNHNALYIYFLFLMVTNMLVESMLESKAGVEFYAIFNAILLNYNVKKIK